MRKYRYPQTEARKRLTLSQNLEVMLVGLLCESSARPTAYPFA